MSPQQQTTEPLSIESVTVVDTDSHLITDYDVLASYLPSDSAAKQMIAKADNVGSDIFTNTRATPAFPNDHLGYDESGTNPARSGADTPEGKIQFMEEFDIDYSVFSPNIMLGTVNHDPTAVALASAYNDLLVDRFLDVDDRLFATMAVANQVPDRAAEEIDRIGDEKDVVGVQMPGAGMVPPAGHWQYDAIYQAAQERGLPIVMHSHDIQAAVTFPVQRRWAETFTESHAFTFPAEFMWHLISLVFNGVPERFPDLEFVLQEPGFEWLPWMMWRLDDHYLQNSEDLPSLTKMPSEYIRDQFYLTTQPLGHTENYQHVAWMVEMAGGADTLLFSTDHPHPDFDTPNEVFSAVNGGVDRDDVEGIMGGTAIDLFGLV
ncbi:amidohydrolase (plasmid) [Halorarum halophilum]|uniref:Amidohydrolase n=1 Tax=Halorarum halophilum TaxID=2743090 RepID=A0A7D5KAJ1_9EURY|nr:amidohydrolase family protein [Halobaculum halophilum]QLG29899.1 amidohydrolase [Halobaculum halophilum]